MFFKSQRSDAVFGGELLQASTNLVLEKRLTRQHPRSLEVGEDGGEAVLEEVRWEGGALFKLLADFVCV